LPLAADRRAASATSVGRGMMRKFEVFMSKT
jgi:hypothetical protein